MVCLGSQAAVLKSAALQAAFTSEAKALNSLVKASRKASAKQENAGR